jgi:hypothetical protein
MPVTATAALDVCPSCKTVYELVRHHIRPPADPVCEACQQALPVADGNDWLTYRAIPSRFVHESEDGQLRQVSARRIAANIAKLCRSY